MTVTAVNYQNFKRQRDVSGISEAPGDLCWKERGACEGCEKLGPGLQNVKNMQAPTVVRRSAPSGALWSLPFRAGPMHITDSCRAFAGKDDNNAGRQDFRSL